MSSSYPGLISSRLKNTHTNTYTHNTDTHTHNRDTHTHTIHTHKTDTHTHNTDTKVIHEEQNLDLGMILAGFRSVACVFLLPEHVRHTIY